MVVNTITYSGNYERTRYQKKKGRTQYNFLTPNEVKKLFHVIPSNNRRDIVIFKLMVYCGLRESEIVGCDYKFLLKCGDIAHSVLPGIYTQDFDIERNSLEVIGKGGKKRTVGIPTSVMKDVLDYLMDFWDGETNIHLIQNNRGGTSISGRRVRAIFARYRKLANLNDKTRVHDLRHTYAMRYLEKGGDVRDLMKAMGHTDLKTTMVYVDLKDEQARIERSRQLIEEEEDIIEEF